MTDLSPAVSLDTIAAIATLTGLTTVDAQRVMTDSRGLRGLVADGAVGTFTATKRAKLEAIATVARAYVAETLPVRPKVTSPEDVVRFIAPALRDLKHEEFHVVLLDTRSQIIRDVTVTKGLLDSSLVHPRETFRVAVQHAAAGIIIAHNHPSGDPTPSAEDRAVTRQLVAAGQLLDIPVYDHVIIAGDKHYSFGTAGLI